MTRFLMEAGPVIWPIILLAWLVAILALINLAYLLGSRWTDPNRCRRSIDAILFWGSLAAALGFLGQWLGLNNMAQAVAEYGIVNPQLVVYGLSESLLTPIAGMAVLLFSATLWFLLRVGLWRRER